MQVVLFCGDQLSAAELADLALAKFNIRVASHFQVLTGPLDLEHWQPQKCVGSGHHECRA